MLRSMANNEKDDDGGRGTQKHNPQQQQQPKGAVQAQPAARHHCHHKSTDEKQHSSLDTKIYASSRRKNRIGLVLNLSHITKYHKSKETPLLCDTKSGL